MKLFSTRWFASNAQMLSIIVIFVALLVFFGVANDNFFTVSNLTNAGQQIAPTVIVAVAMTFVITSGGIDLSVGSLLAVCGSTLAILAQGGNVLLATLVVLAIGAVSGTIIGYISSYHAIPAFIVTLAALTALRGVAQLITEGYSTPITSPFLVFLGQGEILGVYTSIWIALLVAILGWYVFAHTRFGLYVKAVGSNAESARRAGINTRKVLLFTLMSTGVAAAIAGILVSSRLGSGSSNIGVAFELEVITAVVLGGTSLMGGKGSVIGAVFGALTLGVLSNGLVIIGMNVYWVPILQGLILLAAIFVNTKLFSRLTVSK